MPFVCLHSIQLFRFVSTPDASPTWGEQRTATLTTLSRPTYSIKKNLLIIKSRPKSLLINNSKERASHVLLPVAGAVGTGRFGETHTHANTRAQGHRFSPPVLSSPFLPSGFGSLVPCANPRTCSDSKAEAGQNNGYAIRIVHMYLIRVVTSVGQVLLGRAVVPLNLGLFGLPPYMRPFFARICCPHLPHLPPFHDAFQLQPKPSTAMSGLFGCR